MAVHGGRPLQKTIKKDPINGVHRPIKRTSLFESGPASSNGLPIDVEPQPKSPAILERHCVGKTRRVSIWRSLEISARSRTGSSSPSSFPVIPVPHEDHGGSLLASGTPVAIRSPPPHRASRPAPSSGSPQRRTHGGGLQGPKAAERSVGHRVRPPGRIPPPARPLVDSSTRRDDALEATCGPPPGSDGVFATHRGSRHSLAHQDMRSHASTDDCLVPEDGVGRRAFRGVAPARI